jgi:hypothetical protein
MHHITIRGTRGIRSVSVMFVVAGVALAHGLVNTLLFKYWKYQ